MTGRARTQSTQVRLLMALVILLIPLMFQAPTHAYYTPDGTKPGTPGTYTNPSDGMCVIGLKLDGTLLVDWSITTARDCVAWTKSADGSVNLAALDTSDKCTKAGFAGNDGYKHAWSTSLCYDAVNQKGISRLDLDNTDSMCFSKGGTVVTTGKCVAYGWVYLNRKADGSLPVTGTGLSTTTGTQAADNLGFCATAMRMTSATFNSSTTCPSKHNSRATADPVGGPYTEWPDCQSSTTGCQTQASYDAGLGWAWDSTNARCNYTYGVTGIINAAATKADGSTYAAGTTQDLTVYTSQGACLANGFAWDNWLPVTGTTTRTNASGGEYAGMPNGATIRKLDALTAIEDGGGDFYSGTGSVCQKCHSDQSRSYQERDKPGFPNTRHKLAGDAIGKPFQPYFTEAGSAWGLQGVQCAMCHSTSKPAQDDLLQVVPAGVVGPPAAGAPKSASGHNQTEYGTHLTGICYTCHGTAAAPSSNNPASAIPVTTGDFALTSYGLAPIANQFLNSPHAKYIGSSSKVDVGDRTKYTSTFEGWVCRTGAGKLSSTTYPNQTSCNNAGYTWYTTTANGSFCYHSSATCTALPGGTWNTSFVAAAYPWAADTGGPGAVCSGIGVGSIVTTVYRDGVAEKIENVDSVTNPMCTNAGDGSSTSGAAAFWVKDGETSPGVPADTAQGNCMTCHDVHWALAETNPEAEPIRRECTTCHSNEGTSASGAPQVDVTLINHLKTRGTPLENWQTEPTESCEICHMPRSGNADSSRAHLWRISTDASYRTMGSNKANSAAEGSYTDASWVDLDLACGQCHGGGAAQTHTTGTISAGSAALQVTSTSGLAAGQTIRVAGAAASSADLDTRIVSIAGSTVNLVDRAATSVASVAVTTFPTTNDAPYYTKSGLAAVALGMHDSAGVSYPVTFTYSVESDGLTVDVVAQVSCGGACPLFTYDWNWGDGSEHGTLESDSHTYASGGIKTITLTVRLASNGGKVGDSIRNVTLKDPDLAPVPAGTCTWDANTWVMTLVDDSHDDGPDSDTTPGDGDALLRITAEWGDGSTRTTVRRGGTVYHTYRAPGTYTINETAVDSKAQSATAACATQATPAFFMISGIVQDGNGANVSGAVVRVRRGSVLVKTIVTGSDGRFTTGSSLKPGAYRVEVTKLGYTFANPALALTVGPSSTDNTIVGVAAQRTARPRRN